MNLLLSPNSLLLFSTSIIMLVALGIALRYAPWRLLFAEPSRQHFMYSSIIALALIWMLQINVKGALAFHPLLMTVVTMLFGWSLALIVGFFALIVLEIFQLVLRSSMLGSDIAWSQLALSTLPADFCLSILVPVSWALLVIGLVNRWRFKNPFTYFLGVGFFGAMISCLLAGLAAILLFEFTNSEFELASVKDNFIIFFVMTFPEGFINGTVATMFTIFWPEILKTYRDDWYLDN